MNMKKCGKRFTDMLAVTGMVLLTASGAGAVSITVDGDISDWVQNAASIYAAANPGNSAFSARSGVASWVEDGASGTWGYVEPGYGGQNFDVEAMYAYYDSSGPNRGLYVAVVTGFDPGGVRSWGGSLPLYTPGDLFLNFAPNDGPLPDYDLAVELYGPSLGHVFTGTGTSWYTMGSDYPGIGPNQIVHGSAADRGSLSGANGSWRYSDIVADGLATGVPGSSGPIAGQWDNQTLPNTAARASGNSADWNRYDHNVIEVYLSESFLFSLGFNATSGVSVVAFWTESCGNDWGATPSVNIPPIPEPVSMLMLGCLGAGMLGARQVRRLRAGNRN